MSDDRNVLLEEDCYRVIKVDNLPENMVVQPDENDNDLEILPEEGELRSYRFMYNCRNVALWLCLFYNLLMVLLLVFVFIYKRRN